MYQIPPPPPPPDSTTAERWKTQATMYVLLTEDYGSQPAGVVAAWLQEHLGAAADMVGPPDVSANTLVSAAAQLSTPGLYGLGEPNLGNLQSGAADLARWISDAGYWTKMQVVQRNVFGVGDWVLALDVSDGKLTIRHAEPHRVYARADTVNASVLLELRELRYCKVYPGSDEYAWFWFCYKIDGEPAYSVRDEDGKLCSNLHLMVNGESAPVEGLTGDAYPFRYKDGRPFIPYCFYSDCDAGSIWNLTGRRGARVGALNSIVLSTYAMRAALATACPPIISVNLQKPSGNQRGLQMGTQSGDPSASDSITVPPGAMLFLQETSDCKGSPQVTLMQTGNNLASLDNFIDRYTQSQMSRMGLGGDDVQRNSANPTSAGALSISRAAKRETADRVAPFFRRCDQTAIRMAAALARISGVGDWPETGWTISYQRIPLSADEAQAQREQELHDKSLGLISTVDIYLRRNPGQSRADAIAYLRRVAEEEAMIRPEPSEPPETPDPQQQKEVVNE